jgi:hypothetical protein
MALRGPGGPVAAIAPVSSRPLGGRFSGREGLGAEFLAEISDERIEEYVFDRKLVALITVQLSPSFGLADVDPVGRTVTGTVKTVLFDKRFQKDRSVRISLFPVDGESLRDGAQDSGGKILARDPRDNEKARIIHYEVKVPASLFCSPADERVPSLSLPG